MRSVTCMEFISVVVLIALVAVTSGRSDELLSKTNLTQGKVAQSNILGIQRIKPLASGQYRPVVLPIQKNPELSASSSSNRVAESSKEKESEAIDHDHVQDDFREDSGESQKAGNLNVQPRSNVSSSLESGNILRKQPLLANHHDEQALGSDQSSSDENVAVEVTAHDAVERYQQHQSAEDDSDEDHSAVIANTHPNPPKITSEENKARPKSAESVVVSSSGFSSGSFPVRLGPNSNVNIRGNSNSSAAGSGVRKPIPVVRHEETLASQYYQEDRNRKLL